MPQFPIQPSKTEGHPQDSTAPDPIHAEVEQEKKPIKFKSAQPAKPVTRVRINGAPKTRITTRNPFKDERLFDDKDSLIKFRDEIGRPLVLTIGAIALVTVIYWYSRPAEDQTMINEKLAPLLAQADEFDAQTATSSEQFQSRIELADQLIGFTTETSAADRGAELKLRTLAQWNINDLKLSSSAPESMDLLESTSRQFINSRNKNVSNYAKLGLTLIRVIGYLESPDPSYFPEILSQFELVANFASDDELAARSLMDIATAFASKGFEDEAAQYFHAINVTCSNSHNQAIATIGLDARGKISDSEPIAQELKSMLEGIETISEFPLDAIRERIRQSTSVEKISAGKMESILDFVEYLIQRNAILQTQTILADISTPIYRLPEGIERRTIKKRFDDIQTIVKQFEQVFNFEGLYSVEGRPISQSSLQRRAKMVVFWSPENSKSVDLLDKLSDNFLKFANRKIQLIAVVNISDNVDDRNKILELSNQSQGIDFLTLVKGDVNSQALLSRYPITKIPSWILLDPDDKIRGLNISPPFIQLNVE